MTTTTYTAAGPAGIVYGTRRSVNGTLAYTHAVVRLAEGGGSVLSWHTRQDLAQSGVYAASKWTPIANLRIVPVTAEVKQLKKTSAKDVNATKRGVITRMITRDKRALAHWTDALAKARTSGLNERYVRDWGVEKATVLRTEEIAGVERNIANCKARIADLEARREALLAASHLPTAPTDRSGDAAAEYVPATVYGVSVVYAGERQGSTTMHEGEALQRYEAAKANPAARSGELMVHRSGQDSRVVRSFTRRPDGGLAVIEPEAAPQKPASAGSGTGAIEPRPRSLGAAAAPQEPDREPTDVEIPGSTFHVEVISKAERAAGAFPSAAEAMAFARLQPRFPGVQRVTVTMRRPDMAQEYTLWSWRRDLAATDIPEG